MLTSGQGSLSFVGFSSLASASGGLGYVPVVTGDAGQAGGGGGGAAEDYSLAPDIRLLLTKLTKKDATTRTKALQELLNVLAPPAAAASAAAAAAGGDAAAAAAAEAVAASAEADETAVGILPHWSRLYTKLCLDTSRQVRQQAHNVMGMLGRRAKKKLMPYLQVLAGPWLAAQFDPSADAGTAAKNAFHIVFASEEKRRKTVSFCSKAIVKYAENMLLQQTVESLCDGTPTSSDPHEKMARFERARSGALKVLAELLELRSIPNGKAGAAVVVAGSGSPSPSPSPSPSGSGSSSSSAPAPEAYDDALFEIAANSKLWKLAAQSEPSARVRASVHQFIAALAQHAPQLIAESSLKRVFGTACSGLAETTVEVLRFSWNAVFQCARYIPDVWSQVNPRKAVWPHVWGLLRDGGRGLDAVLFASFVSWIAKVPDDVIGEGTGFHKALLDALDSGRAALAAVPRSDGKKVQTLMDCQLELFTHFLLRSATDGCSAAEYVAERYIHTISDGMGAGSIEHDTAWVGLGKMLPRLAQHSKTAAQSALIWSVLEAVCTSMLQLEITPTKEARSALAVKWKALCEEPGDLATSDRLFAKTAVAPSAFRTVQSLLSGLYDSFKAIPGATLDQLAAFAAHVCGFILGAASAGDFVSSHSGELFDHFGIVLKAKHDALQAEAATLEAEKESDRLAEIHHILAADAAGRQRFGRFIAYLKHQCNVHNVHACKLVGMIMLDLSDLNVFEQPAMASYTPAETVESILLPMAEASFANRHPAFTDTEHDKVGAALNACIGAAIAADRKGDDASAMLTKVVDTCNKPGSVATMHALAEQFSSATATPIYDIPNVLELVQRSFDDALSATVTAIQSIETKAKLGSAPTVQNDLKLVAIVFADPKGPLASCVSAPVLMALIEAMASVVDMYTAHGQCPPQVLLDAVSSLVSAALLPKENGRPEANLHPTPGKFAALEVDGGPFKELTNAASSALANLFLTGTLVGASGDVALNPALASWIDVISATVGAANSEEDAAATLAMAFSMIYDTIYVDATELSQRPQYSSIIASCAKAAAELAALSSDSLSADRAAALLQLVLLSAEKAAVLCNAVEPNHADLLPRFVTQQLTPCLMLPEVAHQKPLDGAPGEDGSIASRKCGAVSAWVAHVSFAAQTCRRIASIAGSELQVSVYHDQQWTLAHGRTLRHQAQGCGFWVIDELEACQEFGRVSVTADDEGEAYEEDGTDDGAEATRDAAASSVVGGAADGGRSIDGSGCSVIPSTPLPLIDIANKCLARLVSSANNGPHRVNAASVNTLLAMLTAASDPSNPISPMLAGNSAILAELLTSTATQMEAGAVAPGTAMVMDAVIAAIPNATPPLVKLLRQLSAGCTSWLASNNPTTDANGPAALVLLVACTKRLLAERNVAGEPAPTEQATSSAPISRLVKESMVQQGAKDAAAAVAATEELFENQLSETYGLLAPVEAEDEEDDDAAAESDGAAPSAFAGNGAPWWMDAATSAGADAEDGEATPSQQLAVSVAAAQYFSALPEKCGLGLSNSQWDFLLCTTVGWLETDPKSWAGAALLVAAIDVLIATHEFFADLVAKTEGGSAPAKSDVALAAGKEWADFFAPAAAEFLINAMETTPCPEPETAAETAAKKSVDIAVCRAMVLVPGDSLLEHAKLSVLYSRLASENRQVQLAAFLALSKMIAAEPVVMAKQVKEDTPLAAAVVESIQMATHIRGLEGVGPKNDGTASRCLMLACLLFCRLFRAAADQSRAALVALLKPNDCLDKMLTCASATLSTLSPADVKASLTVKDSDFLASSRATRKGNGALFDGMLGCRLFECALRSIPAIARNWFEDLGRSTGGDIAKFVTKYVSPRLIELELKAVSKRGSGQEDSESFAIKARPAAAEVCGVYSMDEMTMELVVKFNKAHPLYRVEVECSRRVGVPTGQWRNWLLQMITYISNQNGTILDAFMLWKQNVDKRFDGIDDCCICYSAIHGSNYSLPDKRCKTCNNVFHSACLYKWFSSSQQSTCPLCRNIWIG